MDSVASEESDLAPIVLFEIFRSCLRHYEIISSCYLVLTDDLPLVSSYFVWWSLISGRDGAGAERDGAGALSGGSVHACFLFFVVFILVFALSYASFLGFCMRHYF